MNLHLEFITRVHYCVRKLFFHRKGMSTGVVCSTFRFKMKIFFELWSPLLCESCWLTIVLGFSSQLSQCFGGFLDLPSLVDCSLVSELIYTFQQQFQFLQVEPKAITNSSHSVLCIYCLNNKFQDKKKQLLLPSTNNYSHLNIITLSFIWTIWYNRSLFRCTKYMICILIL